jgi:sigma-B regulation protein RsbU (phosphoserine phosphatase)
MKEKAKKPKSIFLKIALWITPVILLLDLAVLFVSYNITYDTTLKSCETQIKKAADIAVQYTETSDLSDRDVIGFLCSDYSYLCNLFDISYTFAVKLDVDKNTETYIAIGFGSEAAQEAKDTRYPGVVVEGMINNEELEAFHGEKECVFSLESTTFDDSLICYMPCKRNYNIEKGEYLDLDEPIIIGTEMSLRAIKRSFQHSYHLIAFLTILLTLVIVAAFAVTLYFRVSRPMSRISNRMSSFVADREKKKRFEKLEIKGNDEFSLMASSFNVMAEDIDRYIGDIDALTREKHTRAAELNIARRIQMGLLRPDRFENDRITIGTYIKPARDVGGDLYDYRVLDNGKVFVAIADVSGKGISAALFMASAISILHQFMLTETSPAKILSVYNNTLAAQNPGGLFITTFLAEWDPAAGVLTYSNAGHNLPYILSDKLVALEDAHGVAAGLFEGEEYEDATVPFGEGDILFLYTDGVNEAKNAKGGFYSTERLEEKLSACSAKGTPDMLNEILDDLNGFTHGAEQNDDITVLTLQIKPRPAEIELHILSQPTELTRIKEAVFSLDIDDDLKKTLYLAAEEMFINICSYAYDEPGEVELRLAREDGGIALTLADGGRQFDPTENILDIDEYDHEHAIGGLGRFLTFSFADRYRYEYRDGKNILYLFFSEVTTDDDHKNH